MDVFLISSKIICLFFVLTTPNISIDGKHEDYAGWKSYYINTSTIEQLKDLNDIRTKLELDFLSPPNVKREAVVLVKPGQQKDFVKTFDQLGIKYRIHVDDVESALNHDDEMKKNISKTDARDVKGVLSYKYYPQLKTIYAYMAYIALEYPETTLLVTPAVSFEGRPLTYMRISTTNFTDYQKPIIFIEGGMHAREWISPPTVTWAIKMLTEHVTDPELLEEFDWILMPVVNPDGYDFTFSGKRFWRKNRSMNPPNDRFCPGVDCNRNFNIAWNYADTSSEPCADSYSGNEPFSETETQVIRDVLVEHQPRIALYLSMHSFGSLILHPWAHNDTLSYNYDALTSVGNAMSKAFDEHGPKDFPPFVVGSTSEILYKCSGNSADYAHHLGVPLAFTIELPGFSPDRRYEGFELNTKYIEDVCRGTWAGIAVGAKMAKGHDGLIKAVLRYRLVI